VQKFKLLAGPGSLLTVLLMMASLAIAADTPPATNQIEIKAAGEDTLFRKETYVYEAAGRRDPFKSLVKKIGEGSGVTDISTLDVSNLTLTGIIWGPSGRVALVSDTQGVGYIIRSGDQVIGGKVFAITDTSVVFEQGDPGNTVKFVVPLTVESKSKGGKGK
jgi:hypothetical protein